MKQKYRSSQRDSRLFWGKRIAIIAAVLLLVFVAFLMLGLLLKNRSEYLEKLQGETTEAPQSAPSVLNHGSAAAALKMNSASLLLNASTPQESVAQQIRSLPVQGYNGVAVLLTDLSGKLVYESEVLAAAARTSSSGISLSLLRTVASEASAISLRSTAVLSVGTYFSTNAENELSAAVDAALIRELEDAGFSEVILTNLPYSSLSDDALRAIRNYLSAVRQAAPQIDIGFAFLPEVYLDEESGMNINSLSLYADFLSLDVRPSVGSFSDETAALLQNEFTLHNLRALLSSSDVRAAQIRLALSNAGCASFTRV